MTFKSTTLPSEEEVQPWYDAVCALWDDEALYRAMTARGREIADERYTEAISRKKHLDYFTSLEPGGHPILSASTHRSARG
jgi:hypothetical protein